MFDFLRLRGRSPAQPFEARSISSSRSIAFKRSSSSYPYTSLCSIADSFESEDECDELLHTSLDSSDSQSFTFKVKGILRLGSLSSMGDALSGRSFSLEFGLDYADFCS